MLAGNSRNSLPLWLVSSAGSKDRKLKPLRLTNRMPRYSNQFGGLVMTIGTLTSRQQIKATHEVSSAKDVRTIIANHLGVDVKRVTDEAHFTDDLGADCLDRLELMIVIEDQFPAVEITDDDVDQIDVVGDLIRHIAGVGNDRRQRPIVETPLQ